MISKSVTIYMTFALFFCGAINASEEPIPTFEGAEACVKGCRPCRPCGQVVPPPVDIPPAYANFSYVTAASTPSVLDGDPLPMDTENFNSGAITFFSSPTNVYYQVNEPGVYEITYGFVTYFENASQFALSVNGAQTPAATTQVLSLSDGFFSISQYQTNTSLQVLNAGDLVRIAFVGNDPNDYTLIGTGSNFAPYLNTYVVFNRIDVIL